jgi:hypothetical protein
MFTMKVWNDRKKCMHFCVLEVLHSRQYLAPFKSMHLASFCYDQNGQAKSEMLLQFWSAPKFKPQLTQGYACFQDTCTRHKVATILYSIRRLWAEVLRMTRGDFIMSWTKEEKEEKTNAHTPANIDCCFVKPFTNHSSYPTTIALVF